MLDTNVCIALLRGTSRTAAERLGQCDPDDVVLSAITLAELEFGAVKSRQPDRNFQALIDFCAALAVLPFDEFAAATYGTLRAELERSGRPIGSLDTLIAAHALALGLTLVTDNQREFTRVKGLHVIHW
jgi:tRNA(fMet)-specific endonuclease VapC